MGDGCAGLFNKESGRTNGARVEGIRAEAEIRVKTQERRKPENVKERIVIEREYKNIRLESEQVGEFEYQPGKCKQRYRIVVVRKNLSVERGEAGVV